MTGECNIGLRIEKGKLIFCIKSELESREAEIDRNEAEIMGEVIAQFLEETAPPVFNVMHSEKEATFGLYV
jgi:hypothetical protein